MLYKRQELGKHGKPAISNIKIEHSLFLVTGDLLSSRTWELAAKLQLSNLVDANNIPAIDAPRRHQSDQCYKVGTSGASISPVSDFRTYRIFRRALLERGVPLPGLPDRRLFRTSSSTLVLPLGLGGATCRLGSLRLRDAVLWAAGGLALLRGGL